MTELRERIARAIHEANNKHIDSLNGLPDDGQPAWDEAYEGIKQHCYRQADAVLAAIDVGRRLATTAEQRAVVDWMAAHAWNAARLRDTLTMHSIPGEWVGGEQNELRQSLVALRDALDSALDAGQGWP